MVIHKVKGFQHEGAEGARRKPLATEHTDSSDVFQMLPQTPVSVVPLAPQLLLPDQPSKRWCFPGWKAFGVPSRAFRAFVLKTVLE